MTFPKQVNLRDLPLPCVKLLTEGLPGIHQRFIPKKRFVCSRESTKRFLCFFPGNDANKTLVSKLHIYHHCSENLMRFWHLLIDRPCLVKKTWKLGENLVKTWWNHQVFTKKKKEAFYTSKFHKKTRFFSVFWWNLWVLRWNLGWIWWISKTWWKTWWKNLVNSPSFFLVKTLWNFKTWWKPGENLVNTWWIHQDFFGEKLVKFQDLVKTWWKPGEFTKFFFGENLVKFQNLVKTWWIHQGFSFGENLVKFQNLVKTWWKPGEFTNFFLVKTWWNFKTWWKLGEIWKPGENLVNPPFFFFCENLVKFENLVKTWWIHQVFEKSQNQKSRSVLHLWNSPEEAFWAFFWWNLSVLAVNLKKKITKVTTWWKPGENLVKTWWIHQGFFLWWKLGDIWKPGENLVNSPGFFFALVKTWWDFKTWWKPGDNLMNSPSFF